jgi:hypothetical protein
MVVLGCASSCCGKSGWTGHHGAHGGTKREKCFAAYSDDAIALESGRLVLHKAASDILS